MDLKFRKYGGEKIGNLIEYVKNYIKKNPNVTISVGCDSSMKRKGILYATTIMFYDHTKRNGAHIIYSRKYINDKLDIFSRLYKEAEIIFELAEYLDENLKGFHKRQDLNDELHRTYKLHLDQIKGKFLNIDWYDEQLLLNSYTITNKDKEMQYKICDIHLDFNVIDDNGKNKSHNVFKIAVPWFKSAGYRVFCKPYSHASTSAADLLVK
jgi:predicted RNase H-related nuclease YkuK (DUF458 family)